MLEQRSQPAAQTLECGRLNESSVGLRTRTELRMGFNIRRPTIAAAVVFSGYCLNWKSGFLDECFSSVLLDFIFVFGPECDREGRVWTPSAVRWRHASPTRMTKHLTLPFCLSMPLESLGRSGVGWESPLARLLFKWKTFPISLPSPSVHLHRRPKSDRINTLFSVFQYLPVPMRAAAQRPVSKTTRWLAGR